MSGDLTPGGWQIASFHNTLRAGPAALTTIL
jgi:hypothetical protein